MSSETRIEVVTPRVRRKMPSRKPFERKVVSGIKKDKKKPSRSKLVAKLDAVFSLWNRTRFASENGMVKCYTCPKVASIKSMQNGHYVTRSIRVLRWEPNNCRVQCYGCNVMHGGQPITFRENLIQELGEDTVLALEAKRHELFNPSDEWLQNQIQVYTHLISLY